MKLLLSMGQKPGGRIDVPLRPLLRWLDPSTGHVDDALWLPVDPHHHPGPAEHAECTGAHLDTDGTLWQATRTEVLRLALPSLDVLERISHPWFHDVHDVLPDDAGGLWVASTGIDAVLHVDRARTVDRVVRLGALHPTDEPDWRRIPFDRTKPRAAHPNHLEPGPEGPWITSLETRDARDLDGTVRVHVPEGPLHDGRLLQGLRWFTTVDGLIVACDPLTGARRRTLDLRRLAPHLGPGWCRAVEQVERHLFVGWTTLRAGRHREALAAWWRGKKRPTRLLRIDLDTERLVAEHEVGNAAGGTLYTITAVAAA